MVNQSLVILLAHFGQSSRADFVQICFDAVKAPHEPRAAPPLPAAGRAAAAVRPVAAAAPLAAPRLDGGADAVAGGLAGRAGHADDGERRGGHSDAARAAAVAQGGGDERRGDPRDDGRGDRKSVV